MLDPEQSASRARERSKSTTYKKVSPDEPEMTLIVIVFDPETRTPLAGEEALD